MFPVYRDMNSHPCQRNQTPSPQFLNPTWEAFPPQMKEDQTPIPQTHEYWPHNYGYPSPMPCQNCCTHGHHPSYYNFRPPYPHFPPPPSPPYGHYCGGYPAAFPQPYPYVPPPYYSMEMPRYEYDKGSSKAFHCCECPNHPSHKKSTNNVKIEEHDPDGEMDKVESLVPAGAHNSPYPILWVPPAYMMNKEPLRQVVHSDADEQRVSTYVEKPQMQSPSPVKKPNQGVQPVERDPNVRYQWFPLDMNNIRHLLEGGEVMKPHDQEKKDGDEKKAVDIGKNDQNKQFSYPIIWMPYDGQGRDHIRGQGERNTGKTPAEEQEEGNKDKQPVEEHSSSYDVVKHPDKELVKERTEAGDHAHGAATRGSHKTGNVRRIPVQQLDDPVPKSLNKQQESEGNGSMKNAGEIAKQESSKNGTDIKPSSSTKKSKLPPICLRVDPPRKKNGKGSSRLPSPPGEKKRQESHDSKEEGRDKEQRSVREDIQVKEVVENDSNGNDIVVSYGREEEGKGSCTQKHKSEAEGKVVQDADSRKLDGKKCGDDGMNAPEPQGVKETKHEDTGEPVRKILSETEAASIIQSAYRGYGVRRWEPLKKLRQIANVSKEASKIKRQIEKLESCVTVDNKEKVAIGEAIMNLLLKLDTVQGLHPSVRDVRRSVAKELMTLQEKLDCIVSQKSIPTDPYSSTAEVVQGCPNAFGSDGDAAGSLEISRDASRISEQGDESDAHKSVENQKEDEDVCSTGNEEPRETHGGEVVPQNGSPSDYEGPALCLEMKKQELDKTITTQEDSTMESHDPITNSNPFEYTPMQLDIGSCDKDQEANLGAKSPQETVEEQVEDDICRMDWECDLGAAKITHDISQEATQVAEVSQELDEQVVNMSAPSEKCDGDAGSAFEVEKVEEKYVLAESQGGGGIKEGIINEVESSGKWNNYQEVDQSNGQPEVHCDDSLATEHESEMDMVQGEPLHQPTAEEAPCVMPVIEMEDIIKGGQETEGDGRLEEVTHESLKSLASLQTASGDHTTELLISEECKTESLTGILSESASDNREEMDRRIIEENEKLRNNDQEVGNPLNDKPEVQCDDFVAIGHGHDIPVETREEENPSRQASEMGMEIPILQQGDRLHKPTVEQEPLVVPVTEVKQFCQETNSETVHACKSEEATNEPRVSGSVKEEHGMESPTSPSDPQKYKDGASDDGEQIDRRIIEENEKLRNMVEKLLASGKEQQDVISSLTAKVKDLEKKLPKRNKTRSAKRPGFIISRGKSLMAR